MGETKLDVHDTLMFRPGMPIVCVAGSITLVSMRWSWLRWRWVRA